MLADQLVLFDWMEHVQNALEIFESAVAPFGKCFLSLEHKVLLHEWTLVLQSLILDGE